MEEPTPRALEVRGAGGVRLVGEERGSPEGRPVLLLHGGGQSRHAWKETAARLATAGYRVVAMDARGHGDSEWSPEGAYAMDDFAADVLAVLERFPLPPAVVGASMGGMSALLAQGRADRQLFAAVVLVDVTPRMELAGVARIVGFMAAHPDGFASLDDAAAISAYNPHRSRPRSAEGLERVLRRAADGRWRWRWDPRFITSGPSGDAGELDARMAELARRLYAAASRVEVPTLLVRGAQSDLVSDESAAEFLAAVPHASYVDIGGARHMVAGDDNDAFTTVAVVDFLRGHVGVDAAQDALLAARERAARALRRLGHALVEREGSTADLEELAEFAGRLAGSLEGTPVRDRLAELLARPERGAGGGGDEVLELARHTMVGGAENPFGLAARYRRAGDEVVAEATLGAGFEGAPGRAHAGAISALIDETMAAALDARGVPALTVALELRYLAATPLHLPLELRARVVSSGGDELVVRCRGSSGGRAFVDATGTFAPLDFARLAAELSSWPRAPEDE